MKRLTLLFAGIGACGFVGACSTAADVATPKPVAAAMTEVGVRPAACPGRTDVLYKPQVPQAGFVPAAPSGASVAAPQRIHAADPAYPSASRSCREEGKVMITYCVSAEGKMDNVQVIVSSGFARLDNAILSWAARETHTPGTVNGRPRRYCGLSLEQEFDYMEEGSLTPAIAR
ncbi:MAG TPA: energy transducer TonB [Hyphomonadaceae bacterium]|nr:energy transducer TonB [Hyphomonadaceae bacterium]